MPDCGRNLKIRALAESAHLTIFNFGVRHGRIKCRKCMLLPRTSALNDVHRQRIYEVSQAYDRLLNAAGQEEAAGASLAEVVQQGVVWSGSDFLDFRLGSSADAFPPQPYEAEGPNNRERSQPGLRCEIERPWADAALHVIQLIDRLRVISILHSQPDTWIARDQAVHQVGRNLALVMVFEDKSSLTCVPGKICLELELNLAASLLHFLDRWEFDRNQTRSQTIVVNCERYVTAHPLGVGSLLEFPR